MATELCRGVSLRHTISGIPVLRVHYSADPDRDPALHPEWRKTERAKYTSQGAWDREQEVVHEAGGGELVFAETLNRYADKIIITDHNFEPSQHWRRLGGFDHGKANPTALLDVRVDFDGVIYVCGEYYMPGLSPRQHRARWDAEWPEVFHWPEIVADPTIFDETQAQADGKFKSIAQLYAEQDYERGAMENVPCALQALTPAPERNELLGAERLMEHWFDLEHREPTLKIICRQPYDQRRFGLYRNDCPNLLWELKRTRREKLSAQQLMSRNPSEKIVDKDNHLRDALKYVVLSLPAPGRVPVEQKIRQAMSKYDENDATNRMLAAQRVVAAERREYDMPKSVMSNRQRLQQLQRRRHV